MQVGQYTKDFQVQLILSLKEETQSVLSDQLCIIFLTTKQRHPAPETLHVVFMHVAVFNIIILFIDTEFCVIFKYKWHYFDQYQVFLMLWIH